MEIRVKKLNTRAEITHGSTYAAGYDLHAIEDIAIDPGTTTMARTGLAMEIPQGYFGGIYARSSLASKQGIRPANCVGVVDSDYRGEVMVALFNDSEKPVLIKRGERIAQLIVQRYQELEIVYVSSLDETERGTGGFGSTGV